MYLKWAPKNILNWRFPIICIIIRNDNIELKKSQEVKRGRQEGGPCVQGESFKSIMNVHRFKTFVNYCFNITSIIAELLYYLQSSPLKLGY